MEEEEEEPVVDEDDSPSPAAAKKASRFSPSSSSSPKPKSPSKSPQPVAIDPNYWNLQPLQYSGFSFLKDLSSQLQLVYTGTCHVAVALHHPKVRPLPPPASPASSAAGQLPACGRPSLPAYSAPMHSDSSSQAQTPACWSRRAYHAQPGLHDSNPLYMHASHVPPHDMLQC